MPNIMFSLLIAILSLHFFTVTYRLNGVHRTLFNVPISLFETSIPLINDSPDPNLYFMKEQLEEKLDSYFSSQLRKYVSSYKVSYYYYNREDSSICRDDYCTSIEINLKAMVVLNFQYDKTANFYIRSNIDG